MTCPSWKFYNDYKILSDSQEQFASFCHLEGVEWMFHFELKWDKWANNPCQRWRVCESLPEFEPPSTCKWKKWRLMVTHAVFCIRKLLGVSWIPWIPWRHFWFTWRWRSTFGSSWLLLNLRRGLSLKSLRHLEEGVSNQSSVASLCW